jgi:hypothetical protein
MLDVLNAPGTREVVPIGEIRCDPGGGPQDPCVNEMRDTACQLGGNAIGPGPNDGMVMTATVLRYADTIPGYVPPPPPAPVCNPPCAEGTEVCTAEGCKPDPNAPPPPPALTPEEEAEMHAALDRVKRRVLRCLRGHSEEPLKVHVEVEPGGSVQSVQIDGDVASTDVGSCAEEIIFTVTFTPFEGQNRNVTHEYTP